MTHFLTFTNELLQEDTRLVVNTDACIVTLLGADGCLYEQKRLMPVSMKLTIQLLRAYPLYAHTETLLATLLNIPQEEVYDRLREAERQGEREPLVIPLRAAIWQAKRQVSAFGLDIVAVTGYGYKLFTVGIQRKRASTSHLLAFDSEKGKRSSLDEGQTTETHLNTVRF